MEGVSGTNIHHNTSNYRDPKDINGYIQVGWSDIIAEPEGAQSLKGSWNLNRQIYTKTQSCCYKGLSLIFGPILAVWFGLRFGCLAFQHIWCYRPCLRHLQINYAVIRDLTTIILQAVLVPVMQAIGFCFSRINVRYEKVRESESKDNRGFGELTTIFHRYLKDVTW